jgi:hypothetical protein
MHSAKLAFASGSHMFDTSRRHIGVPFPCNCAATCLFAVYPVCEDGVGGVSAGKFTVDHYDPMRSPCSPCTRVASRVGALIPTFFTIQWDFGAHP